MELARQPYGTRDERRVSLRAGHGRSIAVVTNTGFAMVHFYGGLLRALVANGWAVTAVADFDEPQCGEIESFGATAVRLRLEGSGTSPRRDLAYLRQIKALYRRLRPDVVHHFSTKPVIYGSIAAKSCGVSNILNSITGLGIAFSGQRPLLSHVVARLYRRAFRGAGRVIFINADDRDFFLARGVLRPDQALLIHSSRGIDTASLTPDDRLDPAERNSFVMVSRMLWSKGVREFVDAARLVKAEHPNARFVLIGGTADRYDSKNPNFVPREWLEERNREGTVEWLDMQPHDQVLGHMRSAAAVVLPSFYPEGLPTVLIEGAALGVPLIATDTPGCRDTIIDGVSGFLCSPRDLAALAAAMRALLEDRAQLAAMGRESRRLAVERFDQEKIFDQLFTLYGGGTLSPGPGNHADVRPIR